MSAHSEAKSNIDTAFRAFVEDSRFPCLAGKGVVNSEGYELRVYESLGSAPSTRALSRDLTAFVRSTSADDARLRAFVAVFPATVASDERAFEHDLWTQLQALHETDDSGASWDPAVSDDPDDPRFSFSHAGCAWFVVGMHPRSSRLSRQFRWPTLVFNAHAQFEHLRATGRFERLQSVVREREIVLQGALNPNLADFGERSEARQYSGRAAEAEWKCPFHRRGP